MDFSPDLQNFTGSGLNVLETNKTCAALSLESNKAIVPPTLAITIRIAQVLYFSLINVIALTLNSLVVFLVIKFKSLRTFSFVIVAMLATSNLNISFFSTFRIFNALVGRAIYDVHFCVASAYLVLATVSFRNSLLLIFSVDRFANVFAPFNYPKYSCRISSILCALTYCIGLTVITTAVPMDCYMYLPSNFNCIISANCNSNCQIIYLINIVYQIPMKIAPILCFIALYAKGRKIRQQDAKLLGSNLTLQEWRAVKTFMVLFVAVFLVNVPPVFLLYIAGIIEPTGHVILQQFASALAGSLLVTDPIILLKNADIKECIGRLVIQFKNYRFKN